MTALTCSWGETFTFEVAVTSAGVAVSLAGKTLRFLAKPSYGTADGSATITKNTGTGIAHTDEAGGIALVTIDQADTAALDPTQTTVLLWDVKLFDGAAGYVVESGTLSVGPAVVRAAS